MQVFAVSSVAQRFEQSAPSDVQPREQLHAGNGDLIDACEQWLAASGTSDDAVEGLAQPLATDLSRVAGKYIGETEKNIARLFDAAQCRDAPLLLDESDALFGRPTVVRDSHDHCAALLAQHPAGCSCSGCSRG